MRTTPKRSTILWMAALLVATVVTGCRDTPSAADLQWQIEHQIPGARLERESHIHLGHLAMGLAKRIVRWASDDEDEEALRILRHVRKVCVATYRVVSMPSLEELDASRFEKQLARRGWEVMVRERDGDKRTWVYTRNSGDGGIKNLYVVSLDDDELTVVDVAGRLDKVIAEAMADDPGGLVDILGP